MLTVEEKQSMPQFMKHKLQTTPVANAMELAKARRILLTADWAVTPEEKQLARKTIDRLTNNAAKKGFKGQ
jgi:hypothetical protein